jgi:MFS family permease
MRMALIAQPVIVVWFVDHLEVSVAGMYWLTSLGSAFAVLAEIPSGYISDRLGRKHTLLCAFLAMGGSFVAAGLAPGRLWLLVVFQILKGVGSALFSGTDMALLYETMKQHGMHKGDDALTQESLHIFAITATESMFSVLGGYIAARFGVQTTVFCAILPFACSGLLCLAIQEPPRLNKKKKQNKSSSTQQEGDDDDDDNKDLEDDGQLLSSSLKRALAEAISPKLRAVFIIGMLLNAATYHGVWMHQLLWERAGISTGYFGVLWASLNIAAAVSALSVTRFRAAVGGSSESQCLAALCGGTVVAYCLMASPTAATTFCGGLLLNVARGLSWPLIGTVINRGIVDDGLRATVLSAFAGGSKVVGMASGPPVGRIADVAGLGTACLASGALFGGVGLLANLALASGSGGSLAGEKKKDVEHEKPD